MDRGFKLKILHHDTQHTDIQHSDIQHTNKYNATLSILPFSTMAMFFMLIVTYYKALYAECHLKPTMLSVVMLNITYKSSMLSVVMLNVT